MKKRNYAHETNYLFAHKIFIFHAQIQSTISSPYKRIQNLINHNYVTGEILRRKSMTLLGKPSSLSKLCSQELKNLVIISISIVDSHYSSPPLRNWLNKWVGQDFKEQHFDAIDGSFAHSMLNYGHNCISEARVHCTCTNVL